MNTRFRNDNSIRKELVLAVNAMNNEKEFDIDKFFNSLEKVINNVTNEEYDQLIHKLVLINPVCKFGIIYYLLKGNYNETQFNVEFNYLKKFVDYEIDLFMLYNFIS